MSMPNFFLVGAPKCGTSSMHDWLGQHPDVFMPRIKEPHFFDRDFAPNSIWCIRNDEKYARMFQTGSNHKRRGESTTWYLYSQAAPREIRAASPGARIIAMLRHPVDAMYSLHGHYLYSGQEDIADFNEALAAEGDRKAGQRLSPNALFPKAMLYSEVYRYARQVRLYFEEFGAENVKIILFDDFTADPARIYRETLDFLGVSDSFTPRFDVVNQAKVVSPGLSRFLLRSPRLRKIIHAVIPRRLHQRGYTALTHVTGRIERSSRIPSTLRAELLPRFQPDIEELEQVLQRDLSCWRKSA